MPADATDPSLPGPSAPRTGPRISESSPLVTTDDPKNAARPSGTGEGRGGKAAGPEPGAPSTRRSARTWLRRLNRWTASGRYAILTAIALVLLSLGLRLDNWGLGRWLIRSSYDVALDLALPRQTRPEDSPVVIVYLDLQSYLLEKQNPNEPWDRSLHARLLDRLTRAGARAVVFDILFTDPGPDPKADERLAAAIRANGRVILGADLNPSSRDTQHADRLRTLSLFLPTPEFRDPAAAWGLTTSQVDEDFVVRRHFPGYLSSGQPSLTWATAHLLDLPVASDPDFLSRPAWIRYYGGPFTIPHLSFSSALDDRGISDDFFRNRVVFIGARPMAGAFGTRRDELRSPLANWADPELFHPGVEVHAIQMLNLLRGDWLRRSSPLAERLALAAIGILASLLFFGLRPAPGALVLLGTMGAVTAGAAFSVARLGQWQPWLIVAAVQLPLAFTAALLHHSVRWYRERRLLAEQRRAAERTIREQAALIDKARDAILVTDLDGCLTYANPGACELYGGSLPQLQAAGLAVYSQTASDAARQSFRDQVRQQGEWSGELHQTNRRGQALIVQSRWTLLRDETGRPRAFLIINTDLTEKKELERQFFRTQRMQTIGSLAGGMAHDLNNALAPVLMGVELLQRRTTDADTRRMLEVMGANTQRGADLVRQVLLFARGRVGDMEPLGLGAMLREMEALLREIFPPSITLQTLVPDDLWQVRGQATELHQLLLNLCVNARDAMPSGGTLTLAADNVELSESDARRIPHARPGAFVVLLVSDTGSGIPADLQPRIFEAFFTTKPPGQGTGLGLSVVASVVKNHQAFLRLESTPDSGTTFEVYLPRTETQPDLDSRPKLAPPPRGNGELVLIVDDEQSVREMLATALSDQGYRPLTAPDALEALRLLPRHAAELRLVVLDHLMPRQDGAELLSLLRRRRPDLPAIVATGQATPELNDPAPSDPQLVVLPKPFPLDTLFHTVHRLLHNQQPTTKNQQPRTTNRAP